MLSANLRLWLKTWFMYANTHPFHHPEGPFRRKGGLYTTQFLIVQQGVLSALQNSWEATSLEIHKLFHVALWGKLGCCATFFIVIVTERQLKIYETINVLYFSRLKRSCVQLKACFCQIFVPSDVVQLLIPNRSWKTRHPKTFRRKTFSLPRINGYLKPTCRWK